MLDTLLWQAGGALHRVISLLPLPTVSAIPCSPAIRTSVNKVT